MCNIDESLARIKRRHTELHPEVWINPNANMRNKIVLYIGGYPMSRCTIDELSSFFMSLQEDEEVGREPNKNWLRDNQHIVEFVNVGNTKFVKLTKNGKRIYDYLKKRDDNTVINEQFGNISPDIAYDIVGQVSVPIEDIPQINGNAYIPTYISQRLNKNGVYTPISSIVDVVPLTYESDSPYRDYKFTLKCKDNKMVETLLDDNNRIGGIQFSPLPGDYFNGQPGSQTE